MFSLGNKIWLQKSPGERPVSAVLCDTIPSQTAHLRGGPSLGYSV